MSKILALTLCSLLILATLTSANAADTPLEQSMKKMSKAYKQLVLDLKAPAEASKPDYLALAATMKTEAATSRTLVPKKVAGMPADQQAAQVTAYQKSMDDLSASIDTLSADLTASKWDDATKQLAALKQQMIDGHKQFRKKE